MRTVEVDGFYDNVLLNWLPHEPGTPFEFDRPWDQHLVPTITFRPVDPTHFFVATAPLFEDGPAYQDRDYDLMITANAIAVHLLHNWDKKNAAKMQRLVNGDETAQDEILIPDSDDPSRFSFPLGIEAVTVVERHGKSRAGRPIIERNGARLATYLAMRN